MVKEGWESRQNRSDSAAEDRIVPSASSTPGKRSSDLQLGALHQARSSLQQNPPFYWAVGSANVAPYQWDDSLEVRRIRSVCGKTEVAAMEL